MKSNSFFLPVLLLSLFSACIKGSLPPYRPGPSFTSFQYDARDNLIRSGVTYDNNVNPYRTSPVWQFVFNDFSRNNPSETFYNGPEVITGFNGEEL